MNKGNYNDQRIERVTVRLTDDEKRNLEAKARELGMNVSTYIRFALLGGKNNG